MHLHYIDAYISIMCVMCVFWLEGFGLDKFQGCLSCNCELKQQQFDSARVDDSSQHMRKPWPLRWLHMFKCLLQWPRGIRRHCSGPRRTWVTECLTLVVFFEVVTVKKTWYILIRSKDAAHLRRLENFWQLAGILGAERAHFLPGTDIVWLSCDATNLSPNRPIKLKSEPFRCRFACDGCDVPIWWVFSFL